MGILKLCCVDLKDYAGADGSVFMEVNLGGGKGILFSLSCRSNDLNHNLQSLFHTYAHLQKLYLFTFELNVNGF